MGELHQTVCVCVWAEFRVRTYTLTHVAASTGASRAFGSRVRQLRKQSSCLVCVCQIFYYLPSILSGRLHAHAMRNPYFIAVYCRINESHSKSHYTLVFFCVCVCLENWQGARMLVFKFEHFNIFGYERYGWWLCRVLFKSRTSQWKWFLIEYSLLYLVHIGFNLFSA